MSSSINTYARDIGIEFDVTDIRRHFPILNRTVRGNQLVYLDNAATTQKPNQVIEALTNYYTENNANVHRGIHALAEEATQAYEKARVKISEFIGSKKSSQIVFTRGATESINLIAYSWALNNLSPGDRIVLTEMEHHANLVPWLKVAKDTGAELKYIPVLPNGLLDLDSIHKIITPQTKLVSLVHVSNVLGTINQIEEITRIAHENGAVVLVDGAQAVPHMSVDVNALDVDFYAFSSHKMIGPTGIGVLYGKSHLLEEMEPFNFGGEMIREVRYDHASWADVPHKFEAGTPNIAGAVGLHAAVDFLQSIGMKNIHAYESELVRYAMERLEAIEWIKVLGPDRSIQRGGMTSFIIDGIHPHDIATFLDSLGIAVRAGHHCAQPLHRKLGIPSTTRASFYLYNTKTEIDALIDGLEQTRRFFLS